MTEEGRHSDEVNVDWEVCREGSNEEGCERCEGTPDACTRKRTRAVELVFFLHSLRPRQGLAPIME